MFNKDMLKNGFGASVLKVLFGVFLVYLIIYLGSLTSNNLREFKFIGKALRQPATIVIEGDGKVTAAPDVATVTLGLVTEKPSVSLAQKENSERMNRLLTELKNLGIKDEDVQTSQYSIYPRYDYRAGRSSLAGYAVNQSVTVKIRDLGKVDQVLAKAGQLEANQVSGLTFIIDDPENLRAQARAKALADARKKADALARDLGVRAVRLVSYNEVSPVPPIFPLESKFTVLGIGGEAPAPPPDIKIGSLYITVNVSVVYEVE